MDDTVVYLIQKVAGIPGMVLALTLMGFSKAYSSYKLGDPTPKNQGRVTLNPFSHIDWIGFIMILILGFGWSKPVTINSRYYKHIKRDCAIQILSGPVGCFAGGLISSFLYVLVCKICNVELFSPFNLESGAIGFITYMLYYSMSICIFIGFFFLLPIPGFDGFDFIANFLPPRAYSFVYRIEKYRLFIFIGAILLINYTIVGNILITIPASFMIEGFVGLWNKIFFFL